MSSTDDTTTSGIIKTLFLELGTDGLSTTNRWIWEYTRINKARVKRQTSHEPNLID